MGLKRYPARIRRALAAKVAQQRVPVKQLAFDASCSERTVRNFLNGHLVRDDTIEHICRAACVNLELQKQPRNKITQSADQRHGSYSKDLVSDYLGYFYAFRRSFSFPGAFVRSLYRLEWDQDRCCLRFQERQSYLSSHLQRRVNYNQEGDVFISNSVGLVHLLTESTGALRLITLTRLHPDDNIMRGVVLTQAEFPQHYQPAVSPIYFRKLSGLDDVDRLAASIGMIEERDPDYNEVKRNLEFTERSVANFAGAAPLATKDH